MQFLILIVVICIDLKTVHLTKAEFINLVMESKLFTVLSDLYDEREEEDDDFFVYFHF